ncbi:ankyrin, partial [Choiromyces venosus 120613-1]
LLLDNTAEIDAENSDGQTALHLAISVGGERYEDFITLLLDKGANVNATDQYSETPLHYAARHQSNVISQVLIDAGASINVQNHYHGDTPLNLAVQCGSKDVIGLLLRNGA